MTFCKEIETKLRNFKKNCSKSDLNQYQFEKKTGPPENYSKTEILQKYYSLFWVMNVHYNISKWTKKFSAKQPGIFAKLLPSNFIGFW